MAIRRSNSYDNNDKEKQAIWKTMFATWHCFNDYNELVMALYLGIF
jgi:hypothetical protein